MLAERAGVTQATFWRRLERLSEAGVLRGERAVINWRALGYEVEVSLRFTLDKTNPRAFDEFIEAAQRLGWGRNTLTRKIQELGLEPELRKGGSAGE